MALGSVVLVAMAIVRYYSHKNPELVGFRQGIQTLVTIQGQSMSPRLESGQSQLINLKVDKVHRNDIVVFRVPQYPRQLIKRIVGVPGDQIRIERVDGTWSVVINGQPVRRSTGGVIDYGFRVKSLKRMVGLKGGIIPDDYFFVVGDLPSATTDSSAFGFVAKDQIIGALACPGHEVQGAGCGAVDEN